MCNVLEVMLWSLFQTVAFMVVRLLCLSWSVRFWSTSLPMVKLQVMYPFSLLVCMGPSLVRIGCSPVNPCHEVYMRL